MEITGNAGRVLIIMFILIFQFQGIHPPKSLEDIRNNFTL